MEFEIMKQGCKDPVKGNQSSVCWEFIQQDNTA